MRPEERELLIAIGYAIEAMMHDCPAKEALSDALYPFADQEPVDDDH